MTNFTFYDKDGNIVAYQNINSKATLSYCIKNRKIFEKEIERFTRMVDKNGNYEYTFFDVESHVIFVVDKNNMVISHENV